MNWLGAVFGSIGQMLGLAVPTAYGAPDSGAIALGVVLVVALSVVLGQVAVLRLNRITGLRLVGSVLVATVLAAALRLALALTLGVIVWLVSAGDASVLGVAQAYAFALSPYVLGFLVFIPYAGLAIARILELWVLLCLTVMAATAFGSPWLALAVAATIWILGQVISRLVSGSLAGVAGRVWTRLTGQATIVTPQDIMSGVPFIPVQAQGVEA